MTFGATQVDGTIIGLSTADVFGIQDVNVDAPGGDVTLGPDSNTFQVLGPAGGISVILPAPSGQVAGKFFWICSTTAQNILVVIPGPVTICANFQNQSRLVGCDGTNWYVLNIP